MDDFDTPDIANIHVNQGDSGALTGRNPLATIYLNPDSIDEATEAFAITATEVTAVPTGFDVSNGVYRISDDPGDVPPAASVQDKTVGSNQTSVDVDVTLAYSGDVTSTTQTVTVPYYTENGSAKAGYDYTAKKGTLEFKPGEMSHSISIPIMNKSRDDDLHFYVKLGTPGPAGASLGDGSATVTIQSGEDNGGSGDDTGPTITVSTTVVGGGAASIKGKAKAGATVELWGAPMGDDSDLKKLLSSKADDDGDYSFSRWIGAGYRFQTRSGGHSSDEKECQVRQDPAFSVSSPSRGMLSLSVASDPKDSGQAVIIQRYERGKWVNAWRGTTGNNGQWRANVKANSRSSWQLRAFVSGYTPDGLLPGYSGGKKVTIK